MSGMWTQGRVDVGGAQGAPGSAPVADSFKRSTSGTAAGTAGVVISAKPGRFYRAEVQNGAATAYFVQVFDKATAPVNADVPVYSKRLPLSGECEIDLTDVNGIVCLAGISIAISSTPGVLTLALATDIAHRTVIYTAQT